MAVRLPPRKPPPPFGCTNCSVCGRVELVADMRVRNNRPYCPACLRWEWDGMPLVLGAIVACACALAWVVCR